MTPHINVFFGLNGAGKTTILEAVSIGAFSRSFRASENESVMKIGEDFFFVRIDAVNDLNTGYFASVAVERKKSKTIKNTYGDNLIPKDIIGKLPIVVLSPDLKSITAGSPGDRRKFLNQILSQISTAYSSDTINLRRCLKQRNSLLASAKLTGRTDYDQLSVLTEMYISLNTAIVSKRNEFIKEFLPYFADSYREISLGREDVDLIYEPDTVKPIIDNGKSEIEHAYRMRAETLFDREQARGTTLFGSRKDDFSLLLDGYPIRETGSQGQHKTVLIALKFAEFNYIKDRLGETPVVLLDDIFSELDTDRSRKVVEFVNSENAQSLITVTNPERLKSFDRDSKNKYFKVVSGKVSTEENENLNFEDINESR